MARVNGGSTATEDLVGVDVEGLCVEGEGPEVVFSGWGAAGGRGKEGGGVGLDLVAGVRCVIEV